MLKFNICILIVLALSSFLFPQNDNKSKAKYDVFSFEKEVRLPGISDAIFDNAQWFFYCSYINADTLNG